MIEINVNKKIREIISYSGLSDRQFCLKIGINPSVLGSMFQKDTEPSAKVIKLTLNAFTDVSADWLLRDKGPMLLSEIAPDSNIERMNRLVDTITTLQGALNEKEKTIKLLEAELARVKNERKLG